AGRDRRGGSRHARGGRGGRRGGLLRVRRPRRRPAPDLRAVADLRAPAGARGDPRGAPSVRPVAGPAGRGDFRERRLSMSEQWNVPKLRIDVSGDWFDDDVEVTHPGVLANLRANLRRDAQGYFIQTRVRIPVEVADAPVVVIRFERSGDGFVAFLNDGT